MSDPTAIPDELSRLQRPEHLLLWGFRAVAMGHGDCPALRRGFASALGAVADETLMSMLVLVRTLGLRGRRRLRLHTPGCLCVSPDEQAILALFAAAQDSLRTGDESRVRAHLAFLIESAAGEYALFALQAVVAALDAGGHVLPLRESRPPPADHLAAEHPAVVRLLH